MVYAIHLVPFVLMPTVLSGYIVFKDTLNLLQAIGPVYWVYRDYVPPHTPFVSIGFMRETSAPWRIGKGLQISAFSRCFQVGLCKKRHYQNPIDGELAVVGGRFMETPPEEIGNW